MRTSLIVTLALALALPALAAAKGPSTASISGPGVDSLPVRGAGESGPGTPLGNLVEAGGFFPAMFGQSPDPMRARRPAGDLGPKYTVTYVVPGPGGSSRVTQDLYPYAKPSPVTYMAPGQHFWHGERTHGGWYVSSGNLTTGIGLPANAPSTGGFPWAWVGFGAAALATAVAAALLLRRLPRRRPAAA